MKKLVLLFVLLFATCLNSFAQLTLEDEKKLGLVGYLTYVKSLSEFQMLTLASNDQYKLQVDKAKAFNSNYNLIKLETDLLINQLSADLYQKNGLGLYKALNAYLKKGKTLPKKYEAYKKLIEAIDGLHSSFMLKTYSSALAGASIADITAIAELGVTIATSARDFREKKIQSITGLLKELKLEKISELTKPADKEKEK